VIMSTASPLNFVLPEETERDKRWHLSNLELESNIFTILDTYLQPSSGVSAVTAAQEITQLYPTDPATQTPGTHDSLAFTFLYRLWELFVVVVEQIPWHHTSQDKAIDLIKAIRDTPNPTPITFEDGFSHGVKLWADLPVLGAVLVDNVETHGIIINDDSDEQKQSRLRDINFQGFAARLTTEGVWDLSRVGVYRLRDVLEEDPDYYIAGYNELGPHLNVCIRPAEVWISLCAGVISRLCKSNGEGADQNDMPGGKHWTGEPGFSTERWWFWKGKLGGIGVNQEASEETRAIARKMKETMIVAEHGA